jgi:endogenous inhibitor of DNA gyrase (YacG/DUF329 family)
MAQTTLCVYCRAEPVAERYKPFCSDRCKMADLGRWLKGDYAVPSIDDRGTDDLGIGDLELENREIDHRDIEDEQ